MHTVSSIECVSHKRHACNVPGRSMHNTDVRKYDIMLHLAGTFSFIPGYVVSTSLIATRLTLFHVDSLLLTEDTYMYVVSKITCGV